MARVCVVGAGYVGLCTAVALAEHGHEVSVVDVDAEKVSRVAAGDSPFFEPRLPEFLRRHVLAGRVRATSDLRDALTAAGFVFLCVGTPASPDGAVDLRALRSAAKDVGRVLAELGSQPVVVTKSTVPPGTARAVVAPEVRAARVASNPEFLREGAAMHDALHPDRIVVGADDAETAARVWALYERFECPKLTVDTTTAELIKYAANAFLATKVGLSNELANVAERHGVDWYRVAEGVGLDPRIGPLFLRAGAGFGGSCFPKDVAGLTHLAREAGAPALILEAVLRGNALQPLVVVRMLREEIGEMTGKRIALLGLAFKPDTDDVRETRAFPIWEALVKAGAEVVTHDPQAIANFQRLAPSARAASSAEEALAGADGCIVQTEWREYRDLPATAWAGMRTRVVVDGRRALDPARLAAAGVRYRAIGLGSVSPP